MSKKAVPGVWYPCDVIQEPDTFSVDAVYKEIKGVYEVSYEEAASNSIVMTFECTHAYESEYSEVTYKIRKVGKEDSTHTLYLWNIIVDIPEVTQDNALIFRSKSTWEGDGPSRWIDDPDQEQCEIYYDPRELVYTYALHQQ